MKIITRVIVCFCFSAELTKLYSKHTFGLGLSSSSYNTMHLVARNTQKADHGQQKDWIIIQPYSKTLATVIFPSEKAILKPIL